MLKGRAEAAIQKVAGAMNARNQGAKETVSRIGLPKIGTESLSKVALNLKTVV
jgi:hypothetical protein